MELANDLVELDNLRLALDSNVVAVPDVHRARLELLTSDDCESGRREEGQLRLGARGEGEERRERTKDEVVLSDLSISDLLGEGRVGQVGIGVEASVPELRSDLLGVLLVRSGDGDDENLARRDPEGPVEK